MQTLFDLTSPIHLGILAFPQWRYVKDGLKNNLSTVITYYRKNAQAVRSEHFLVRLLQSISIPHSLSLERYFVNVDAVSLNLSMALKMTSAIYRGQTFDGVFYGKGSTEILVAHDSDFDYQYADKHWQNLSPVRVLSHSLTDLELNLPNGKVNSTEENVAVIAINIPMLAIQYRAFAQNELRLFNETGESPRSVMEFIHMYVLPNMLFSHLDHVVFNRLVKKQLGLPFGEGKKRHPFYMADYTDKLNYVQDRILEHIQESDLSFSAVLRTIPLVSKSNSDELMALPDIVPTRQVLWALVMARLPALNFLIRVGKISHSAKNQSDINRALRNIRAYRSDKLLSSILSVDLYHDVQAAMDDIVHSA